MFGAYSTTPQPVTGSTGQSKMHQMQQKHPDMLPDDQRHVMNMLSPLYQRIYMYGLNDDQRESVAVFERRGENPYRAIDNILKRDRTRSDPAMNQDKSPRGRTERATSQKSYIISERSSNSQMDEVYDNDEDYELYTSEVPVKEDVTCSRYKSSRPVTKKKPQKVVVVEEPKPKKIAEPCTPCNNKEPEVCVKKDVLKETVATQPAQDKTCNEKSIEKVKKAPEIKVEKAQPVKTKTCSKKSVESVKKAPVIRVEKARPVKTKTCNKKSIESVKKAAVKKVVKAQPVKTKTCNKKTLKKYRYVENYSRCK